jgi:hypothetical protein
MNITVIIRTVILIGIVLVLINSSTFACTAFMMSDGERILVGNNEDYNIPHTRMWLFPATNGRYGRIYFG